MSRTQTPPQRYVFRNSEGRMIELRGDLTIEDLIRMGFNDIRMVNPDHPPSVDKYISDEIAFNKPIYKP